MTETYNGHANRETWAASMHLGNDEGLYHMAIDAVSNAGSDPYDAAGAIQCMVESLFEEFPESMAMMRGDIGSTWRVDWDSVAEGYHALAFPYVVHYGAPGCLPDDSQYFDSDADLDDIREHIREEWESVAEEDLGPIGEWFLETLEIVGMVADPSPGSINRWTIEERS